jgi:hypothetical protein
VTAAVRIRTRARGLREGWARLRISCRQGRRRGEAPSPLPPVGEPAEHLPVNCIVFSKNRPMQLDALLRTLGSRAPYDGSITVIYLASGAEYERGYELVERGERTRLLAQGNDFRRAVLSSIDPGIAHTVFHTDDDLFFRPCPATPVVPPDCAAFSLRLGRNTTCCYPLNRRQHIPDSPADDRWLSWDWTRADGDFAYPFSLDGHIFATRLLLRLVGRGPFSNPNELEQQLHYRRYLAPPRMLAFRESCVVSVPANTVTSTHRNRARDDLATSAAALNDRFLAGLRIDVSQMDFSHVDGAHQELPFVLRAP